MLMAGAQEHYEKGLAYDREKNYEQAYLQFSAAAELGHAGAQVRVGKYCLEEARRKEAQAFGWLRKAVEQDPDSAAANYLLSGCYERGEGTVKNDLAALQYLLRAAELGDAGAQARLGERYLEGDGVMEDMEEARQWLQKAVEQDPKHMAANYALGLYYDYLAADSPSRGDYELEEEAYRHYLCAAEQGHIEAQYETGASIMCAGPEEKIKWFRKVLAQDPKHAPAYYALGTFFECESISLRLCGSAEEAGKAAFQCYLAAAELGYPYAQRDAGSYYRDGRGGVRQDPQQWKSWYEKAAERQLPKLYLELGRACERGSYGLEKDEELALEYYKKGYAKGVTPCWEPLSRLCKKFGIEPPPMREDDSGAHEPWDSFFPEDPGREAKAEGPEEPAQDRLDALIGLEDVKREAARFIMMQEFSKRIKPLGRKPMPVSMHMVFTGNPGTGKTTVARLIGEIFHERGLLSTGVYVEVRREDLVGDHIGETAIKTRGKIEKAKGGVLFIDEAYTLYSESERDFGREAAAALLAGMEEYRNDLIVIAAGYGREMQRFLDINPGLKSRFKTVIDFQDYDARQLNQIFHKMAGEYDYRIEPSAEPLLARYFERLYGARGENFGNAREVRNFYERVFGCTVERLCDVKDLSLDDFMMTQEDIQTAIDEAGEKSGGEAGEKKPAGETVPVLERLDAMVGLDGVKNEVRTLRHLSAYRQLRRKCGKPLSEPLTMHMVFTGNPGTGKTTVAKMVGEIYQELGLLPRGHVVEVKREELVGMHIGETAVKTKKAIERAMGGVLFIDEAYSLNQGGEYDFGAEAVSTLLAEMEERREHMAVIVAGYESEMRRFIDSNPGLKSRFTKYIHFEDYNGRELAQIFRSFAERDSYIFGEGAEEELYRVCAEMYCGRDKNFGNARDVRKLFSAVINNLAARVSGRQNVPEEELLQITREDILKAEQKREYVCDQDPAPAGLRKIGFHTGE